MEQIKTALADHKERRNHEKEVFYRKSIALKQ